MEGVCQRSTMPCGKQGTWVALSTVGVGRGTGEGGGGWEGGWEGNGRGMGGEWGGDSSQLVVDR